MRGAASDDACPSGVGLRSDPAPPVLSELGALRARRLARRTEDVDRFDVFYQAYVTALLGGAAILVASGWVGGSPTAMPLHRVADGGSAILGLVTAMGVGAALRSGSRGGPLALEAADIRHVLLSPVHRGAALRAPALRQLRFLIVAAAAVGAVGGQVASHRLPGSALAWTAAGALWASTSALVASGAGWVAAGRRLGPSLATLGSVGLMAVAAADLAGMVPWSPTRWFGALGTLPADPEPAALVLAPAAAVGVAAWGLHGLGGVSVEQLAHRSSLVGELRFAATMRDLRTLMLVRRQLHQEAARRTPWLPTRPTPGRTVVVRRDLRALLRIPPARAVRMVGLAVAAGAAAIGIWHGTVALLPVAGACSFLAGLEALEPLAQEVDRCTFLDLAPVSKAAVLTRHLIVPSAVLSVVGIVVGSALLPLGEGSAVRVVIVTTALVAPLAAVAGAAVNVLRDAIGPGAQAIEQLMLPPEAVGMRLLYRLAWPPAIATAGFAPVALAQRAFDEGTDPASASTSAGALAALLVAAVFAWVRYRDQAKTWWTTASSEATGPMRTS